MSEDSQADEPCVALWRTRSLWIAFALALIIRLVVVWAADYEFGGRGAFSSMNQGYVAGAATLASGKGLLMATRKSRPYSAAYEVMKNLEISGTRLDKALPYPIDDRGWIPATFHPAGYSVLLWGFYEIGNYRGMLLLARYFPAVVDAVGVLLLFLFAKNLFGRQVGLWSAWVYALMPGAIALNLLFLPDAYARFFAILILALASYARFGKGWALPAAGFAAGIAFHFRTEFLVWPVILWLCVVLDTRKVWQSTIRMIPAGAAMLAAILPWILWTYQATGRPMLSSSNAGGTMYESLGEIPENPWGIVLDDNWLGEDAWKRGFASWGTSEASEFYGQLWRQHVLEHPGYFISLVVKHRLPLALVPPYRYRHYSGDSDLWSQKQAEGLTKWGFVRKYPWKVLRHRGIEIAMAAVSALLLSAMIASVILLRRNWRSIAWLAIPWLVTIVSMCLVKEISSRNISTVLVFQSVAAAIVITALFSRQPSGAS